MRITGFEIAELNIELKKPFITALRRVEEINDIVIKVHTDSALVGYGEACAVKAVTGTTNEALVQDLQEVIFPALSGEKVERKKIFERLDACEVSAEAKACVDIALFDLLSKEAGESLHIYLGATSSTLQTDLTISLNEVAIMRADSEQAIKEGFNLLKIKLDDDIEKNIQRIRAINEVIPSQVKLRLDPNQALDLEGALVMLKSVKTGNLECIEQPFGAEETGSMKALKEKALVPVLADESLFTAKDAELLLREGAVDMLNIKLMKSGGISEALRISALARKYKKSCMIGSMLEGPISLLAAAHFGLSQETVSMADLDSPIYLKEHPLLEPFHLHAESISLNQEAGLGIDRIMSGLKLFPT